MRFVSGMAVALGALIALPGAAGAMVRIDVDLGAQTMRVVADSGESYRMADLVGRAGHLTPRGVFRPQRDVHDGPFRQVQQRADAALDLLLRPIRDPRHERGRRARQPGLARLHSPVAGATPRRSFAW